MVNTEFYTNAKIYKIVDNTNGNIYVGSTCKKLCQRIAQHRSSYNQYLNGKPKYMTSFKIIANGDYDIILLENCENITNKEQLRARERYYIESLNCVNKRIEGRTQKEYMMENKDKKKEYDRKYFKENKEIVMNKIKEYRNKNIDKMNEYSANYYKSNKDKILEYSQQYRNVNKETLKVKCLCECGSNYRKANKSHHEKTNKHQEYLKTLEN